MSVVTKQHCASDTRATIELSERVASFSGSACVWFECARGAIDYQRFANLKTHSSHNKMDHYMTAISFNTTQMTPRKISLNKMTSTRCRFHVSKLFLLILTVPIIDQAMSSVLSTGQNYMGMQTRQQESYVASNPEIRLYHSTGVDASPLSGVSSSVAKVPINGSLFGKRSLASKRKIRRSAEQRDKQDIVVDEMGSSIISDLTTTTARPSIGSRVRNILPDSYSDIITETIESFLENNEDCKYDTRVQVRLLSVHLN